MKNLYRLSGFAFLTALALVVLGGVVHNTGSSLACPDWPLCFGQVLPKMEGQVAIEHSHRLLATFVGILTIALVVLGAGVRKEAPALFKATLLALAVVIFQGVLGGVTVLLRLSPIVSTTHLATSQFFVGLLLWIHFRARQPLTPSNPKLWVSPRLLKFATLASLLVYIQMCLGAFIRHGGSSVACGLGTDSMFACIDPATFGKTWWPSFAQAQFNMLHRYLAIVAATVVIGGGIPILKWAKINGVTSLRAWVVASHAIVTLQIVLGVLTIATLIHPVTVTFHLLFGMLLWLATLAINFTLRSFPMVLNAKTSVSQLDKAEFPV